MLLDARWVGGLVYFVVNMTLTVVLMCLITWIVLPRRITGIHGNYRSFAISGALAALLQSGSVLVSIIGLSSFVMDDHQGMLPALDSSHWGMRDSAICATEGVTAAYSRAVLSIHLFLLAYLIHQETLDKPQTFSRTVTYLLGVWSYGLLPAVSMIAAFGIFQFNPNFFTWNGLRCVPAAMWWRIAHSAFLAVPTLAALYLSFITLLHLASTYDSPERKGITSYLINGSLFGYSGCLVAYFVFEQLTWSQDTWVKALQAGEPLIATSVIIFWAIQHACCHQARLPDARNAPHMRLPSDEGLQQKQRRSSFFAPALIDEPGPRLPVVAVPPPSLISPSGSDPHTPLSEQPFHFDDVSRASSGLSPVTTSNRVRSKAFEFDMGQSDAASSIYSLPSYPSQDGAASFVPERGSRAQSVASSAIIHLLKIRKGLSTREASEPPIAVDRFGKGMI